MHFAGWPKHCRLHGGALGRATALMLTVAGILLGEPARSDTLTLVADEWCPYNCRPGAAQEGFLVDIARTVFEGAGDQVNYQVVPWSRAIADTRNGKFDAVIGAAQEETPDFVFPAKPVIVSYSAFFVRAGTNWRYTGAESLAGITLGATAGYSYNEEIDAYIAAHKGDAARVQIAASEKALDNNIGKLLASRIGAAIEDPYVMRRELERIAKTAAVIEAGRVRTGLVFIAFSPKSAHSKERAAVLDRGIERLRESGRLKEIMARYGIEAPDLIDGAAAGHEE